MENSGRIINLDGEWLFNYTAERPENGELLFRDDDAFPIRMPVPAYWEDNADRLQISPFWRKVKFNPEYRKLRYPMSSLPPDSSLPNIMGTGWYKKEFEIPCDYAGGKAVLEIGGVQSEAWIWINGEAAGHHYGYSTAFEIPLEKLVKYGEINELIIAVSNTRNDCMGCSTRGPNTYTGGILRSVNLKLTGPVRISDCCLYPSDELNTVHWQINLDGFKDGLAARIIWEMKDVMSGAILYEGEADVQTGTVCWDTPAGRLEKWSDKNPKLYNINIRLVNNEEVLDEHAQVFGLRRLIRKDTNLFLNGKPIMLRGVTEHCYFPYTVSPPSDKKEYMRIIRELKKLGFNWLRFHTWVPPKEYIEAADELGMMIQVEPPAGFDLGQWRDILLSCRSHPSVVIYCCGNEELIDEDKIKFLKEAADICHKLVPDALFSPMEALRGVEYHYDISNLGDDYVKEPFAHNPRRLGELKEFSDVFGQYARRLLSYTSVKGDFRLLDKWMSMYERPCLNHEMGIHGSYINLDLEHRYDNTRMGSIGLFPAAREYLGHSGILDRAAVYYRNSCAWQRILRKHNIEMGRKCKYIAGYDFLGPIDQNWIYFGYPCGIMNEFYEMKPGESVRDVIKYNGESVLLLDHSNYRNYFAGDLVQMDVYTSLYGEQPLLTGKLSWHICGREGTVLCRDEKLIGNITNGCIVKLHTLRFDIPGMERPEKLTIHMRLSGGEYELENNWDFWLFPKRKINLDEMDTAGNVLQMLIDNGVETSGSGENNNGAGTYLVSKLDEDILEKLNEGGRVVLLGSSPFNALPTSFQMSVAGRVDGNLATVIEDHPVFKEFPHEGYCDWQFYSMLEGGSAILLEDSGLPFAPILDIASSFKWVRKQAAVFELRVGDGKLFVCTLNMDFKDPAALWLFGSIIDYVRSDEFIPEASIHPDKLAKAFTAIYRVEWETEKNFGLDPNAQKRR